MVVIRLWLGLHVGCIVVFILLTDCLSGAIPVPAMVNKRRKKREKIKEGDFLPWQPDRPIQENRCQN